MRKLLSSFSSPACENNFKSGIFTDSYLCASIQLLDAKVLHKWRVHMLMLYRQRSLLRHSQSPGSSWAPNRASRSTGHKKQHLNVSWREEQFKEQSLYQVFSDLSTHISLRTLGIWSNAAIVSSTGGKSAIAFFFSSIAFPSTKISVLSANFALCSGKACFTRLPRDAKNILKRSYKTQPGVVQGLEFVTCQRA